LKQPSILIFDIGKTAKKALVFDRQFNVLEEQSEIFPEISDDDGFPADDLKRVTLWMKEQYRHYLDHPKYDITHCNVSGYGASLVNLDVRGELLLPFYNYLKPFPAETARLFAQRYNRNNEVCVSTASPYLGLLNSGLQLFWQKHDRPDLFRRIATTLHLPQYFASLLNGQHCAEITSVGCHTMLWNYQSNDYHPWVRQEGLDNLFPPILESTHIFFSREAGRAIQVGVGVHDSSAALMPYLATQEEPFLLISTGTWNICFNPFSTLPLSAEELASDCLCYLTYEGKPVKASRIFLGHEHEMQVKLLTDHFGVAVDYYKSIRFDPAIFDRLDREGESRPFYPIGMEGTGPLPEKSIQQTQLSSYDSMEEAYHQLIRYLVRWQLLSINLVDPAKTVKNVIVVGGFTRNALFLEILKRSMRERRVLISDHPRASALGAAWLVCGRQAYSGNEHLLSVSPYA
jgi:sugar (pentulose or hexulose) kinase